MTYTLDQLMAHRPSRWRSFGTDQEFLRCCGQDWGSFKKKRKPDEEAYAEWARHVADAIDAEYPRSDGAFDSAHRSTESSPTPAGVSIAGPATTATAPAGHHSTEQEPRDVQ